MSAATDSAHHLRKTYLIGFVLALILTAIPFGIVAFELMPRNSALAVVAILALAQVLVHLHFFLHLNPRTTPRENIMTMAFAAILMFIMIGGTMWIMFDLNNRMMM